MTPISAGLAVPVFFNYPMLVFLCFCEVSPPPWRGYCFFWKLGHLLLRLCTKSDTSFLPNPYICPIDFCNYPKSTPCSFFRKKISSSLRQQFQMLTQWTKRDCLPALHWLFLPAIFKTAAGLGYFWLSLLEAKDWELCLGGFNSATSPRGELSSRDSRFSRLGTETRRLSVQVSSRNRNQYQNPGLKSVRIGLGTETQTCSPSLGIQTFQVSESEP